MLLAAVHIRQGQLMALIQPVSQLALWKGFSPCGQAGAVLEKALSAALTQTAADQPPAAHQLRP